MSKSMSTFDEGYYMFPLLVKEQLNFWPEKNVKMGDDAFFQQELGWSV